MPYQSTCGIYANCYIIDVHVDITGAYLRVFYFNSINAEVELAQINELLASDSKLRQDFIKFLPQTFAEIYKSNCSEARFDI